MASQSTVIRVGCAPDGNRRRRSSSHALSRRQALRSKPSSVMSLCASPVISSRITWRRYVYVSCEPVDFRKDAASLMALVRDGGLDPSNGVLYVIRSKRADRLRIACGMAAASASLFENA
ncbi:IS66 family insertion sequence element accessory protein TnpB [Sinorhizobium sp. 6-70]|uniref:IS66 family insertion sequence element accessory protein TnpB n=1 Tax=Sinorhizobium sp. 6-70 TaxID=3049088 RepID=UPI0034E04995